MKIGIVMFICFLLAIGSSTGQTAITAEQKKDIKGLMNKYFEEKDTVERDVILKKLEGFKNVSFPEFEGIIREGKEYEKDVDTGLITKDLTCEHVTHDTKYYLYVPTTYDPSKSYPVMLVYMGGRWNMEKDVADRTTHSYFSAWMDPNIAEQNGWIIAAPVCTPGWGNIGWSIMISTIDDLKKTYNVNPDRIYCWGQSMGGHAAFRCGLHIPDKWAGVSPCCGGYDYKDALEILNNLAVYHIWGENDPHSAGLNVIGRLNAEKFKKLKYDVINAPQQGGHELFENTFPDIIKYFNERPRNMYPKKVFAEVSTVTTNWPTDDNIMISKPDKNRPETWKVPIHFGRFYWIEINRKINNELYKNDKGEDRSPTSKVVAEIKEGNKIEVTTENVAKYTIYLHDKLVDMGKPVEVYTNGKLSFSGIVQRSLKTMLEDVAAYNDRGRIYYGAIEITVPEAEPKKE